MIEDLKTLWELQEVDSELFRLKLKIESIPQQLQQITGIIKNNELEIEKKKAKEQELSNQRKRWEQDIEGAKDKKMYAKSFLSGILEFKIGNPLS